MKAIEFLTKSESLRFVPGYTRKVRVDDTIYYVGTSGVRKTAEGWIYGAFVHTQKGSQVWYNTVPKVLTVRAVLKLAKLI